MYLRPLLLCLLVSSFVYVSRAQHTLAAVGYHIGYLKDDFFQRFELESGDLIGDPCSIDSEFIASMTFLQNGNLAVGLEDGTGDRLGSVITLGPEPGCVPIETCTDSDMDGTATNMNVDPVTGTIYGTLGSSVTVNSFSSLCEPTPVCSDITTGPPTVATTVVIGTTAYMADPNDDFIVAMSLPASPPDMCSMVGGPNTAPCTNIKGLTVFDSTHLLVVCGSEEMGDSYLFNINDNSFAPSGFARIPDPDRIVGLAVGGAICQRSEVDSAARKALLSGSSGYGDSK